MNLIFNHIQILIIFSITVFSALLAGLSALFSAKLSFWIAKNFWARTICFVSRCQIVAEGLNELKNLNESAIFCSNHLSSFDIIAMYMSLDRPIFFIAKKEIKQIPFLGWYMSIAGMIFLDRSNHENAMRSMRNAGNEIKKGKNIISFPEGTRSKTNQIGQFKRGSFIIAKEGKIPIVPVAIKGSNQINPSGTLTIRKGIIKTKIGKPIYHKDEETTESFANRTRKEVELMVNSL